MGNQREIIQVEPRQCHGVVVPVRQESARHVQVLVDELEGHFYTHFTEAHGVVRFPNLDNADTLVTDIQGPHLIIQSGGKMWCGYEHFIQHLRELAPHLGDALFYVGDEEDYIDKFRLSAGSLQHQRVHEGYWWDLPAYLREKGLLR